MNLKQFLKKDIIIFTIGIALVCYPIVSNYIESINNAKLLSTYDDDILEISDTQKDEMLKQASKWNEELCLKQQGLVIDSQLNYNDILNIGNGIIGTIEIPQIKVNLPIYHGTEDKTLNVGLGHVDNSSFPIGGLNTHTVITGHSGLPNRKLFTKLDELEYEDIFYIKIFNETLAYKIDKIEVVLPEQADYSIEEGKDLATLVTCTPYGINTHRLLVTGHRVPYKTKEKKQLKRKDASYHEMLIYTIPIVFIILGIIIFKKKGVIKHD